MMPLHAERSNADAFRGPSIDSNLRITHQPEGIVMQRFIISKALAEVIAETHTKPALTSRRRPLTHAHRETDMHATRKLLAAAMIAALAPFSVHAAESSRAAVPPSSTDEARALVQLHYTQSDVHDGNAERRDFDRMPSSTDEARARAGAVIAQPNNLARRQNSGTVHAVVPSSTDDARQQAGSSTS
jgi:hypothetical protein